MTTPLLILRESFAHFIKHADGADICIMYWARQRGQRAIDASQLVDLEDAFEYWLQVFGDIVTMEVPCRATQAELKEALREEKKDAQSHLEELQQEKVFKCRHPPLWFETGSSDEEQWRQLLHLHEGGVDTLVVVDSTQRHVPHHFLEVDPTESGVQFMLFSNATQPALPRGFTPEVRVYRPQEGAVGHEIGRFLARIYYAGMLEEVVVLLVTEDCELELAVLQLKDKGLVAARVSVDRVVAALHSRHPHLFH